MESLIHILHLEDDPADAELVQAMLESAGLTCQITRVQVRDEFAAALRQGEYDVILTDYRLPMYDGISALRLAQELCPDVPFIFVSGTMGEDAAIEGLTQGATDYVLKQKLSRLAPAVKRALRDAENRRERKCAEEALHESEERFRRLAENAQDLIYRYRHTPKPCFEYINPALNKILGYSPEEFYADPALFVKILHPDDQRLVEAAMRGEIELEPLSVLRWVHKDGSIVWTEHRHIPIFDQAGDVLAVEGIARDITERKRAEESLRKLSRAVEQSASIIVITDAQGHIEYANPRFTETTGYTLAEAIGQHTRILKSGHTSPEEYKRLWETITAGKEWRGEFHNKRKNGELYWESASISPIKDADGVITHFLAVKEDITERKQAEEAQAKLEEQLRQSQKMESIGRLAGGVAHDFNNMLAVILLQVHMSLRESDPAQPIYARLQAIQQATQHSADLTRQLLAFARKQTIAPQVLDMNETVEGMLAMLRRLIGEDIDLLWKPAANLWSVKMDPVQINQILANLAVNARDAIAGVGKVIIETENTTFDEGYCAVHPDFTCGDYVVLAVNDDGCGMDKDILDHLFEPFFTTKEAGKGTGLGLSTVYGIVKQNDGFIDVDSEPGKGSTFKIYLPQFASEAVGPIGTQAAETPKGRGETVLLVEDESVILNLCQEILEELGYRVLSANSPSKAIRLAEEQSGEIHLLITDVVMPEMNGPDLVKRLQSLYPNLKWLFMSGYMTNIIARQGILDEDVHFIQKPFTIEDLAARVRKALDQKSTHRHRE